MLNPDFLIDTVSASSGRAFALNSNFEVTCDTLWLHQLPFRDSIAVTRGDLLVVAEFAVHPTDTIDSIWVKVARDQGTIGWIHENGLLPNIVPDDPISQFIHLFSRVHTVPFLIVLALFFLMLAIRAWRDRQVKFIWVEAIDRLYPIVFTWLLSTAAAVYTSIQHFVPLTWQRYYFSPTLNPFDVPPILSVFLVCIILIVIAGIALVDDLFHQATFKAALFYLFGLASCSILVYLFFTSVPIYVAYIAYVAWSVLCLRLLARSRPYPYACGSCGAKLHSKGVCPHCGAINE